MSDVIYQSGTLATPPAGTSLKVYSDGTDLWPAGTTGYLDANGNPLPVTPGHGLPISGSIGINNFPTTQGVSGTITANQGGANWSQNLAQVGGSNVSLGQAAMAASVPVTVASNQSSIPVTVGNFPSTQGVSGSVSVSNFPSTQNVNITAASVTQGISGTITANQGGGPWTQNLTQVNGATISLGQTSMVNAVPVVIASNQTVVPVSGNLSAVVTFPQTQGVSGSITILNNPLPVSGNFSTTVNFPATQGISGTITANQGGAWTQNLTQVGGASVSLGSTHASGSIPVITSHGGTVFSTLTITSGSSQMLAPNTARIQALMQNIGSNTVWVGGSNVSVTGGFVLNPYASLTDQASTSAWWGVCSGTTTSTMQVVEVS